MSHQVSQSQLNEIFQPSTKKLFVLPFFCFLAIWVLCRSTSFQHGFSTISGKIEDVQDAQNNIQFRGFNEELIPSNSTLDVNIGTNNSPIGQKEGRHRILVDPLFYICEGNAKLTNNVTAFCFAVSNYTGFATFYEYNKAFTGQSSSLSEVAKGTSHEKFPVLSKRTVLVIEAMVLFSAIHKKQSTIHILKLDMQGHELLALRNVQDLLRDTNLVTHIMAECFCPNKNGKQIYDVDNSCEKIADVLHDAGYDTKWSSCDNREWGDIIAYKKDVATDFLPQSEFASVTGQYLRR
jgi:FkbM family methyltransferase